MIFRKTHKTKQKKIWRDSHDDYKKTALYRVVTYWFLFIPVYSVEELVG